MFALLPMKEHSDRVPQKNFKMLHGQPLFYYIADTIREAGLFTKLVINTDSEQIVKLAKSRYGDWVIINMRPKALQGDFISMNSVIAHDVEVLGTHNDFIQVHSTSPFLKSETIMSGYQLYKSGKESSSYDSLFSVNKIKTRMYDKDLNPINHSPTLLERTQDLEEVYEENSCFYFFSGDSFMQNNHRIGTRPQIYSMDRNVIESLDIDNVADWNFAEAILAAGIV